MPIHPRVCGLQMKAIFPPFFSAKRMLRSVSAEHSHRCALLEEIMQSRCRNFPSTGRARRFGLQVLQEVRIITDPKKLAWLQREADRQKRAAKLMKQRSGLKRG